MYFFDLIVYLLFLMLLLCGCTRQHNNECDNMFTSMNGLRGLFAIEIVVGHAVGGRGDLFLSMLRDFMLIGVSFFFFVSGFGLARSYAMKEKYLNGFLLQKCGYLLSILVICFLQNEVLRWLLGNHTGYKKGFFPYFFNHINWYLWEQMFFYLIFWVVYRYVRRRKILCISLLTIIAVHIMYFSPLRLTYCISAVGFPFGLMFYTYYDRVMTFLLSIKGVLLTTVLTLIGLCSMLSKGNLFADIYLRNDLCLAAILILIYMVHYFRFKNPALVFLGKYSTEIYLYQFICLEIFSKIHSLMVYTVLVLVSTIIIAMLMYPIDKYIRKQIYRG